MNGRQLHVGPGPCGRSPRRPANGSAAGAAPPHVGPAEPPSYWAAGPGRQENVSICGRRGETGRAGERRLTPAVPGGRRGGSGHRGAPRRPCPGVVAAPRPPPAGPVQLPGRGTPPAEGTDPGRAAGEAPGAAPPFPRRSRAGPGRAALPGLPPQPLPRPPPVPARRSGLYLLNAPPPAPPTLFLIPSGKKTNPPLQHRARLGQGPPRPFSAPPAAPGFPSGSLRRFSPLGELGGSRPFAAACSRCGLTAQETKRLSSGEGSASAPAEPRGESGPGLPPPQLRPLAPTATARGRPWPRRPRVFLGHQSDPSEQEAKQSKPLRSPLSFTQMMFVQGDVGFGHPEGKPPPAALQFAVKCTPGISSASVLCPGVATCKRWYLQLACCGASTRLCAYNRRESHSTESKSSPRGCAATPPCTYTGMQQSGNKCGDGEEKQQPKHQRLI